MSSEDDLWLDEVGLKEGRCFETTSRQYHLDKILGEGGFGVVFQITTQSGPKETFAMKVEKKIETRLHSKLKMEIAILKMVSGERRGPNEKNHFTAIIDKGKRDPHYYFIIMQLVGKSLDDLKRLRDHNVFSVGTGLAVASQCLEAVEDLHKYHFIHRDLKAENFACGLPPHVRTIYILDFGIARRFTNSKNELKTPRSYVRFKGTVRFASLACHKNAELSVKDDLESWFYLLLDLLVIGGLPWRRLRDRNDVMRSKELSRQNKEALYGQLKYKDEYHELLQYIDRLQYIDTIDYKMVYDKLKKIATMHSVSFDDPYDFERSNY
ncbi:unnamed protein product, partial [Mesorhabditis spiculigera]